MADAALARRFRTGMREERWGYSPQTLARRILRLDLSWQKGLYEKTKRYTPGA